MIPRKNGLGATVLLGLALLCARIATAAEPPPPTPERNDPPTAPQGPVDPAVKKAGNVLTFYGLRKMEDDPGVSDDEKLREWQAFVLRAKDQLEYAEKAVDRWKNAAHLRVIETARKAEGDPSLTPRAKAEAWQQIVALYPRDAEASNARARAQHWTKEEVKRLVAAAEEVERARRPKIDRIRAWLQLLAFTNTGVEAQSASRRVDALQSRLFEEAQSLDGIARVDDKTKLAAWRDVLLGRPSESERRVAEKRVAALEAASNASQP